MATAMAMGSPARSAHAERFTFAWPVPAAAAVRATIEKDGVASTARYVIDVTRREQGELAVAFRDFAFLTINGEDAGDPRLASALAPLTAVTAALPTMRIGADGNYLGVLELDQALARTLALLPEQTDAAVREQLQRNLQTPAMRALMEQRSGEIWNIWVAAWNGLDLAPGQSLRGTAPVTLLNRALEQQILVEHLGGDTAHAGSVRLRLTTVLEGPEVIALLGGLTNGSGAQAASGAAFAAATARTVSEIVADPLRLVPHYVVSSSEVVLRERGGGAHRRAEKKEYWFDW